jgi:Rox3 mediator complex subunit
VPDDDWHATHVLGKEIEKGLEAPFMAKLVRSMSLVPGKLPDREAEHWRNILATDDPIARPPPKPALAVSSAIPIPIAEQKQQMAAKAAASMVGTAAVSITEATKVLRPERVGTKRSYKDASFMGYGEGFEDDETDDDGRPLASLRRKRRKVSSIHPRAFLGQRLTTTAGGLWRGSQLDAGMGQLEAGLCGAFRTA